MYINARFGIWKSGQLKKMDNLFLSFFFLAANGTDSKKYKGDRSPCAPSRVLHVRKVPIEVSEAEVVSLGVPFGKVTNLLMLKGKNQVGAPPVNTSLPFLLAL